MGLNVQKLSKDQASGMLMSKRVTKSRNSALSNFFDDLVDVLNGMEQGESVLIHDFPPDLKMSNLPKYMMCRGLRRDIDVSCGKALTDADGNRYAVSERPLFFTKNSDKKGYRIMG